MARTLACPHCGARVRLGWVDWLPDTDAESRLRCPACGGVAMLPRGPRAAWYILGCAIGIAGALLVARAPTAGWAVLGLLMLGPLAGAVVLPAFAPFWRLQPYRRHASAWLRAMLPWIRWALVATLLVASLAPLAVFLFRPSA
jgi:hypothetical protein